jgi:hypothetical protein
MEGFKIPLRIAPGLANVVLGLVVLVLGASAPAQAQDWGFFGRLFGGGQPQQAQPPRTDRRYYEPRRRVVAPRRRAVEPRATESAAAPKPPAVPPSHFVVVLGDSLAQNLASGLDDALSDRPDVGVLHKARDSTGLVREDFYNWPKVVDELLANQDKAAADKAVADKPGAGDKPAARAAFGHEKIDVAVMMIGSNDRQNLSENGKTLVLDSEPWIASYTRRAMAIAEAFKKKNIPLIWVGVPIAKSDEFADDMAALNDIYREVAAKTGATFVDTWEAFSDDNGDFSAFGPDINGQTVRLRSADGIHFTKAGGRKLAHFVETHIRHALDQQKPPEPALASLHGPDAGKPSPSAIAKPDVGPVRVLTEAPLATNGQLVAPASTKDFARRDPLVETALVKGEAQTAHPGRADDASWPPR